MMAGGAHERSHLMGEPTAKLGRSSIMHLIASMVLMLVPVVLGIALSATEHSEPARIIPWSASTLGWGELKGDFNFGLRQFAVCKADNRDQCSVFYYQDQKLIMGEDANTIQNTGKAIYIMIIIATVLSVLSAISHLMTLWQKSGYWVTRETKIATFVMQSLASLLFLISALVWATSAHARLLDYAPGVHYSWGFALALLSWGFASASTLVLCLRPVTDDYTPVL